MKHISPQLGFNNNVRHRGRVFHIQTEDSGIKHPHIITHLFADGGRILKTQKTSYAEFLGEEELAKKVRSLMQEQHKAMFMALRGGKFDQLLGDLLEPPKEGEAPKESVKEPEPAAAVASARAEPRAPMNSLTGATDFAQTAAATGENAVAALSSAERAAMVGRAMTEQAFPAADVREAPPPSNKAPPPPSSQPGSNARLAALAAMDEAPPPRSRLTPPPPRAAEGGMQSPLRALASRAPVIDPSGRSGSIPGIGAPRSSARAPMASSPGSVPPPAPRPASPASARPASIRPAPPAQGGNPLAISASLDLDLEALERAAEQSQTPVYKQIRDLPPPPATLLRPSPPRNTSYRSVTPQATSIVADGRNHADHSGAANDRPSGDHGSAPSLGQRPATGSRLGVPPQPASSRGAVAGGRYAPSRPASIFGASRPAEGSSIFGEDLISEKSLDEVILSYLAEDLEGAGKK
jgi:hypothetical protein